MATHIASRLQRLMKAFGDTPESLALVVDISLAALTRILEGKSTPTDYQLHRLGRHFNRAPSWIYYGADGWQEVPIAQRERFKWLDNVWLNSVELESTEEVDRMMFSQHLEGAGKRRISSTRESASREAIREELKYLLADGQHPFRHYYER